MTVHAPVKENINTSEPGNPSPPATNAGSSIVDTLPLKLILMLAAPYLAGKTAEEALQKAHKIFKESKFSSTLDILGEDAVNDIDCDRSVDNYKTLIDRISSNPISCQASPLSKMQQMTVSFKPSMFATANPTKASQAELAKAYERIESVVRHALQNNLRVTLEAEDHTWTDFHLDTYFSLINSGYTNLGTVLQSRLFRTKEDIKRFDNRMRVRMVIGIYQEPTNIALTEKQDMKEVAVEYAYELLKRGVYVELASHDTACMESFVRNAVLPSASESTQFEFQHLLGVPRKDIQQAIVNGKYFASLANQETGKAKEHLQKLAESGAIMRMYLPYGQDTVAGPYCKRRLKANPNMMSYGIKNFLGIK